MEFLIKCLTKTFLVASGNPATKINGNLTQTTVQLRAFTSSVASLLKVSWKIVSIASLSTMWLLLWSLFKISSAKFLEKVKTQREKKWLRMLASPWPSNLARSRSPWMKPLVWIPRITRIAGSRCRLIKASKNYSKIKVFQRIEASTRATRKGSTPCPEGRRLWETTRIL